MASSNDAASSWATASASEGAIRAVAPSQHDKGAAVRSEACAAVPANSSSTPISTSEGGATPSAVA